MKNTFKAYIQVIVALFLISILSISCKNKDQCDELECNTGICIEGICNCPTGFSGPNCEIEDKCITQNILCFNGAECINGICECLFGYTGENCEVKLNIQQMLNNEYSPFEILANEFPKDSLYGKIYLNGIIFYIDEINNFGLVSALNNQSNSAVFGCYPTNLIELIDVPNNATGPPWVDFLSQGARIGDGFSNSSIILDSCEDENIAAKMCRNLGNDWFLPSIGELNIMYLNLSSKDIEGLNGYFISSSEFDAGLIWIQSFDQNDQDIGGKNFELSVRAVRSF